MEFDAVLIEVWELLIVAFINSNHTQYRTPIYKIHLHSIYYYIDINYPLCIV